MATHPGGQGGHFLREWTRARDSDPPFSLINERTGRLIVSAIEVAGTSEERRRGLLGRDGLDPSAALVIAPCSGIHTFFMRFVIDVVFVDRQGRVLKVVRGLRPWRIAFSPRAFAVVEMNGGSLSGDVLAGDRLYLARSRPTSSDPPS